MRAHQLVAGRYRPLEPFRDAGRRVIWQARDEWSSRPVALVRVVSVAPADRDEARAVVAREADVASGLHSDHLARVLTVVLDAETWWVVSEGHLARTLQAVVRSSRVTAVDVIRWGRDVAEGLAAAHRAGLVHRDVHAGLVLLDDGGTARLAGLASTPRGRVDGDESPVHPAPELAAGQAPSQASDVFGWAATVRAALAVADGFVHDGGLVEDVLGQALHPDPSRRPNAASVARRLDQVLASEASAATVTTRPVVEAAGPTGRPAPAGPGPLTTEGRTEFVAGAVVAPPHQPAMGRPPRPIPPPPPRIPPPRPPSSLALAPPAGLDPYGWPADDVRHGPPPVEGRRRAVIVAVIVFVVVALLVGFVVVQSPTLFRSPGSAPGSLLGDTRTADPCSLLSADSVRDLGPARIAPNFISPAVCGVVVTVNHGYLVLSAELQGASVIQPPGDPERVGVLRVFRQAAQGSACVRTVVLPDQLRVHLVAQAVRGPAAGAGEPAADLCEMADRGTTTAVRALSDHTVTQRPIPDPPNALTSVNLCAVFDRTVLAPVSGLDPGVQTPGLNGWSCAWGRGPTYPYAAGAPRVFAVTLRLLPPKAANTSIGDRHGVLLPNAVREYPRSCTVQLQQRTYPDVDGLARQEVLAITVYAGAQPNPDVACGQATQVAAAVAPKLPPAS
ncbi:MAG: protein kinase [Pseudonocardia sp.]|nr:protein kinase [Pseudonocardia sp.]